MCKNIKDLTIHKLFNYIVVNLHIKSNHNPSRTSLDLQYGAVNSLVLMPLFIINGNNKNVWHESSKELSDWNLFHQKRIHT